MRTTARLTAALMALGLAAAPMAATAAGPASSATVTATGASLLTLAQAQEQFSDAELQSFASAVVSVQEVSQAWQARMAEAGDEAELAEMQDAANQEMVQAVESEGISVDQYNAIHAAAQTDEALYQQLVELIEQAQ